MQKDRAKETFLSKCRTPEIPTASSSVFWAFPWPVAGVHAQAAVYPGQLLQLCEWTVDKWPEWPHALPKLELEEGLEMALCAATLQN